MMCVNLLKQHLTHSRSSMSVRSSALQAAPGIRVPESGLSVSSCEISDSESELANPTVSVSWAMSPVSLLSGSQFHHQPKKKGYRLRNGLDKWFSAFARSIPLLEPHALKDLSTT